MPLMASLLFSTIALKLSPKVLIMLIGTLLALPAYFLIPHIIPAGIKNALGPDRISLIPSRRAKAQL